MNVSSCKWLNLHELELDTSIDVSFEGEKLGGSGGFRNRSSWIQVQTTNALVKVGSG